MQHSVRENRTKNHLYSSFPVVLAKAGNWAESPHRQGSREELKSELKTYC